MPKLTIGRVVTVLTPVVFAPLAAVITAWVTKHAPGLPPISRDDVTAVEITAFLGAVTMGHKWLQGLQKHEADQRLLAIKEAEGSASSAGSALARAGALR